RFRGSRTVTSLRLCSRAPWTTSSSALMGISLPLGIGRERMFARRPQGLRAGLPPAAEHEAAEGEAEPECSDRERPDRDRLPPARHLLPAAERLLFFRGQGFAAALLAQGTARTQTEVEVLDDLSRLVYHRFEFIGWVGGGSPDSPRLRPARGYP